MATTTTSPRAIQARKPRPKPGRHVQIGKPVNGVHAVRLTIGEGEKAQHFGYYISSIPADFGLGFQVEKFTTEQVEGEDAIYQVHIDLTSGQHSCTCKGGTYHGHCKHQEAILALLKSGKLQPAPKPASTHPRCCRLCGHPADMHGEANGDPFAFCPI